MLEILLPVALAVVAFLSYYWLTQSYDFSLKEIYHFFMLGYCFLGLQSIFYAFVMEWMISRKLPFFGILFFSTIIGIFSGGIIFLSLDFILTLLWHLLLLEQLLVSLPPF